MDKLYVPYDTKFWREKTLVNLVNCKRFAKIFLSKFSFLYKRSDSQLVKLCFKLNSIIIVILKIDSQFYRPAADSSQLASQCNPRKIAQLAASVDRLMFQPADNQQVHPIDTSQLAIELARTDPNLYDQYLKTIAPSSFHSYVYCSLAWPNPIIARGRYHLQNKRKELVLQVITPLYKD